MLEPANPARLPRPEEIPRAPTTVRRILPAVAMAAAGMGGGYLIASWALDRRLVALFPPEGLSAPDVVLLALGGVMVVWFILLVHELGHVVGGLLAGFQFHLLIAGILRVERGPSGLALGWNGNWAYMGGLAALVPPSDRAIRKRMLALVAAGPLASLFVGGTALLLATVLPAETGPASVLRALTGLFGVSSLLIGVITLIPGKTSGFLTDGARLLQLLRHTPESRRDLALLALSARSMAGQRPSTWSADLLGDALVPRDGSLFELGGLLLNYLHEADRNRPQEATGFLARALRLLPHLPPLARASAAYEAAFHAARLQNPELAGLWLAEAGGQPAMDPGARCRAEALILSDPAARQAALAEAQGQLDAALDRGSAAFYRDVLAGG